MEVIPCYKNTSLQNKVRVLEEKTFEKANDISLLSMDFKHILMLKTLMGIYKLSIKNHRHTGQPPFALQILISVQIQPFWGS